MKTIVPLDLTDLRHASCMFEVRTHPEVAPQFFASPPKNFTEHLKYLNTSTSSKEREYFLVRYDDSFAGYGQLIHRQDCTEIGLALHPKFQGLGLGLLTLNFLIAEAKKQKPDQPIILTVKKTNQTALNLYKKCKFQEIETSGDKMIMQLLHE